MISIVTAIKNPNLKLLREQLYNYNDVYQKGISIEWILQANSLDANEIAKLRRYGFVSLEVAADSGIYSAWNRALLRATGDKVCFLGIDDTPSYDWLSFVDGFRLNEKDVLSTDIMMQDSAGNDVRIRKNPRKGPVNLGEVPYSHPGLFFSMNLFDNRYFLEHYKIVSDGLFYSSAGTLNIVGFFEGIGVSMRMGGISNSLSGARRRFIELFSAVLRGDSSRKPKALLQILASFPAFIFSFFPPLFVPAQKIRWFLFGK